MSLLNKVLGKPINEAIDILCAAYEEKQASMTKQALSDDARNTLIGGLLGAGVGGVGMMGRNLIRGKKLRARDALYGALMGGVPGAIIGNRYGSSIGNIIQNHLKNRADAAAASKELAEKKVLGDFPTAKEMGADLSLSPEVGGVTPLGSSGPGALKLNLPAANTPGPNLNSVTPPSLGNFGTLSSLNPYSAQEELAKNTAALKAFPPSAREELTKNTAALKALEDVGGDPRSPAYADRLKQLTNELAPLKQLINQSNELATFQAAADRANVQANQTNPDTSKVTSPVTNFVTPEAAVPVVPPPAYKTYTPKPVTPRSEKELDRERIVDRQPDIKGDAARAAAAKTLAANNAKMEDETFYGYNKIFQPTRDRPLGRTDEGVYGELSALRESDPSLFNRVLKQRAIKEEEQKIRAQLQNQNYGTQLFSTDAKIKAQAAKNVLASDYIKRLMESFGGGAPAVGSYNESYPPNFGKIDNTPPFTGEVD